MIEKFIQSYIELIIEHPKDLKIDKIKNPDGYTEIMILANKSDVGKIIGKDATTIKSLKTLVNAYKMKDPTTYKIVVKELDE